MAQEIKTGPFPPSATNPITTQPPGKMSYEEFLAWTEEGAHVEWVDGEVVFMSPVSTEHQLLAAFLAALLQFFVEANDLGLVLTAPFQMKLEVRPSGREPDVIFIAGERRGDLKRAYLDGAADLAIEVISPESRARDRGEKYYEYEQAGVREYWLVDPTRKQAEFYRLGKDQVYHVVPFDHDGIFRSAVLDGLWLKVAWLWQEPLPTLMSVLKEWGLVKE
jgi:Uma2 family endonuclease